MSFVKDEESYFFCAKIYKKLKKYKKNSNKSQQIATNRSGNIDLTFISLCHIYSPATIFLSSLHTFLANQFVKKFLGHRQNPVFVLRVTQNAFQKDLLPVICRQPKNKDTTNH